MSYNKTRKAPREKVFWNGEEVAEFRGLTPADLVKVITENPIDADVVLSAIEKEKSAFSQETTIADGAEKVFGKVIVSAPRFLAKVLAEAADDPGCWEDLMKDCPIPLQFDMASKVAQLTFVDPPSFRRFLGNVMALVGMVSTKSALPNQSQNPEAPLAG